MELVQMDNFKCRVRQRGTGTGTVSTSPADKRPLGRVGHALDLIETRMKAGRQPHECCRGDTTLPNF